MWNTIFSFLGLIILPLALVAWFTVSLVMFLKCPKEDLEKRKNWRISLVISSVILGVAVISVVALIALFAIAIAFM